MWGKKKEACDAWEEVTIVGVHYSRSPAKVEMIDYKNNSKAYEYAW